MVLARLPIKNEKKGKKDKYDPNPNPNPNPTIRFENSHDKSPTASMKGELQLEPSGERNPSDSDPLLQNQHVDSPSSSSPSPSSVSSGEIKNEDIEAGSVACCRICLECDGEEDDELISPCMCKGTQQFVHRSCLDHWRSVKASINVADLLFHIAQLAKLNFIFELRSLKDNSWRKIKFRVFVARDVFLVIGAMGGFAYVMDKDGSFRNSFNDSWDRILSKHPIPFYYCIGVLAFFVLLGFFGLVLHCSSLNSNDPRMAGCQNCCYGWGILDCFPASMEACFALVIVFVVVFAILGIAYGFLAATMAIQRIWQRHYHILTKRELTKEYIVEDLHGCYAPPKLDPEHEERLKILKLL
ncbi:hypothetical protein HYC85_016023 [Camellia sinensis]|uniref:RING-CH-type domain-containing protein n=1 Tax=Camellia sinensis TaxID=4442 RepID=A0A7J7GZR6_CAMSI|nr:hypothetical protein HYC85_016023 [Camellia sinensis]